ncbi:hypothetical protein [Streptomyces xantholiticus]|uniref:Uncharacterized protein n=1 Tax=Streptomyces xantholiticus TaxID=68285 RepID=A0ABV1V4S7_9ACTN
MAGLSGRSRAVLWLVSVVSGVLAAGLVVLMAVADLDTAALAGGIIGTMAALASTVVAVLALLRSPEGAGTSRPPVQLPGQEEAEPGGVSNSISGGTQLNAYQGRDFFFGTPTQQSAAPSPQPPPAADSSADGAPSA